MYESLMEDLQDIQTYVEPQGRKTVIEFIPVKAYTAAEVKSIRKDLGVSQPAFAKCLGVSRKTVEKWESGDDIPSGPASRLLNLILNHTISTFHFIKHVNGAYKNNEDPVSKLMHDFRCTSAVELLICFKMN